MKTIKEEWLELKANLSPEEQNDGMRCFYCGALLALEMQTKNLSKNQMALLLAEIEGGLTYQPEPSPADKDEM